MKKEFTLDQFIQREKYVQTQKDFSGRFADFIILLLSIFGIYFTLIINFYSSAALKNDYIFTASTFASVMFFLLTIAFMFLSYFFSWKGLKHDEDWCFYNISKTIHRINMPVEEMDILIKKHDRLAEAYDKWITPFYNSSLLFLSVAILSMLTMLFTWIVAR